MRFMLGRCCCNQAPGIICNPDICSAGASPEYFRATIPGTWTNDAILAYWYSPEQIAEMNCACNRLGGSFLLTREPDIFSGTCRWTYTFEGCDSEPAYSVYCCPKFMSLEMLYAFRGQPAPTIWLDFRVHFNGFDAFPYIQWSLNTFATSHILCQEIYDEAVGYFANAPTPSLCVPFAGATWWSDDFWPGEPFTFIEANDLPNVLIEAV
jgi:hypothetical protein